MKDIFVEQFFILINTVYTCLCHDWFGRLGSNWLTKTFSEQYAHTLVWLYYQLSCPVV